MSHPTPARFLQALAGFQLTAAIRAAIELDLFTAIASGHDTPSALHAHTGASERGVRILSDFLTIAQFLQKDGERYVLAPDTAAFLDKRSPSYLGDIVDLMAGPTEVTSFLHLTPAVRKGGTVLNDEGGTVSRENPFWETFAKTMASFMTPAAGAIAGTLQAPAGAPMKVLDIAAGHGLFGITIARQNPNAEIYALDWAPVLRIAASNAEAAGVADRWHAIHGSAFEQEFGEGYDVVLLTNFLHHFSLETIAEFLPKVYRAVKPEGVVVTLEFIPNEDRVTPPEAAAFALTMLANTAEGDAYTMAEYERVFRAAGFTQNQLQRLEGSPQSLILSRR